MRELSFSQVLRKGVDYLSSVQEKNGSFLSFSSTDPQDFTHAIAYQTTFLSSFILLVTASLPQTEKLKILRKKTAKFLLSEKSDHWSWNYWARNAKERKVSPYPDDLDDTFCALTALLSYEKKLITGKVWGHIVQLLTATERKEGGPYKTWLVKKDPNALWQDVDFAVNANIAYFLSLNDIQLPNLDEFFEKKINKKATLSPYYPSLYAPLYFVSRFYSGGQRDEIKTLLLQQQKKDGSWENPLNTALAILTLLTLEVPPKKIKNSIEYLFDTQKNGKWKAYGFCIDPSKDKKKSYAGSPALTTAFCLAALQFYQSMLHKTTSTLKQEREKEYIYKKIRDNVALIFATHDSSFQKKAQIFFEKILEKDKSRQIPLIAYYFFLSLKKDNKKISKSILIKLGTANVLGWIAYTIYDNFLDEEGEPAFLPLANSSLRYLTTLFDSFPHKKKQIQNVFHTTLNIIDQANTWEIEHARNTDHVTYKSFAILANKSIGHALGPLTILLLVGHTQKQKEYKYILSFFNHYLIAKQLNDDAHDWEEDLKRGHITPVVSILLQKAKEKKSIQNKSLLKEIFWYEVITDICHHIDLHTKKAKQDLAKSNIIVTSSILEKLLETYEKAAEKALEEQKNVIAFLDTYKTK